MLLFLNFFCLVFGSYCCYCWSYCQHAPRIYLYHLKTLPPSLNTMLMYFNKKVFFSLRAAKGEPAPLDCVVIAVLSGCSSSKCSKEPLVAKFFFVHSPCPIGQSLKSASHKDIFYVAMLRYVSYFPSCKAGFSMLNCSYLGISSGLPGS